MILKKKEYTDVEKAEWLYLTYSKLMYKVAYEILQDKPSAEDAVGDAFVRVMQNLNKISAVECARTRNFMAIISRNIAINMYKKKKRELSSENDTDTFIDTYNPEQILINEETYNTVKDIIMNLDEKYRDAILLSIEYKMTAEEIANATAISAENAKKRLQRARKMILAELEKREKAGANNCNDKNE